jgi:bifunctional non-homologous end joining protein LigD
MKAHIGDESDLERKGMLYEPKLDGIRALCYVNTGLRFYSRNQRDISSEYREFQFRDAIKAKTAILDGEIIVLDKSLSPRFSLWQQGHDAHYVAFDILMLNGKSLVELPLIERKQILDAVVTNGGRIEKCVYTKHGEALWKEMLKRDMEGVMAKQEQSHYYPGARSSVWLKIKAYKTMEAIILGYTSGKRKISSLVLGVYSEKKLIYIGKVGTGFTEAFLRELLQRLKKIELKKPLNVENIARGDLPVETTHWLRPELVCEIKYLEFTDAGKLRAPVFERLRPDKNPEEVTFKEQDIEL